MKKVFIKRYGWLEILEQNQNFALLKMPSNSKICFNILGYEIKEFESENQLKMELL